MLVPLLIAALAGAALAQQSPNANLVQELLQTSGSRFSTNIAEDAVLNVRGLVRKYGYPLETHTVVTSDGYIVTMHRIPRGRDANADAGPRVPVLVMHGLMCSSADFLVLGPGNALGYLLAEAGYDVWLANARGNYYSRRHLLLDPDDREGLEFWKFSWDEIGNRDLPALVNHIVRTTGQEKMHYIGYSQGGTAFVVLNSLRPEYNERFLSFQALAPAVFSEHSQNGIRDLMVQFEAILEQVAFSIGFGEVMGKNDLFPYLGLALCSDNSALQRLCMAAIVGTGTIENFNATMLPVIVGHNPAGAAIRQIIHFSQVQRFGRFQRYNHFRPMDNLLAYGSLFPPEYDLSRVTTPTFLHYGLNDANADYRDILLLGETLPNAVLLPVPRATFNHFDFIWGGDVREQLYDRMIDIMKSLE